MAGATADASARIASISVFQLAWPVMVANLLQTLTTTVDVIMVGALGSEAPAAVSAVGVGGQFIFLFFSVMISVSAGTIALVARAIGSARRKMTIAIALITATENFAASQPLFSASSGFRAPRF